MSIFCQEQIELPSQSAKCNYTEAFLDAAHLKQFYAFILLFCVLGGVHKLRLQEEGGR